jgi:hypothetical protein
VRTTFAIAPGFEPLLRAAGLDSFERAMAAEAPPSAVTRAVPGRFTVRIEAPGADRTVLYLKRHRGRDAGAAAREWRRLGEVGAAGIPCPERVALGERRGLMGSRESLLITLGIPRAEQADRWIRDHPDRRGDLIDAVAVLARRFHDAGFHHRDLYLCHFFVRESGGIGGGGAAPLEVFLIDLQRCGRLGLLARRWLVKDLAQVHISLGQAGLGPEDWDRFAARYGGLDRRLLRAILRKSARIARHVPRYG